MPRFEVYPKDLEMIRQLEPVVRVIEVESTCRRGILGGYNHAAQEMVERLVDVLNDPKPVYYPGRYIMDTEDEKETTFLDTEELVEGKTWEPEVGHPVKYRLRNAGEDTPLPEEFKVARLVGMLNYLDHMAKQSKQES